MDGRTCARPAETNGRGRVKGGLDGGGDKGRPAAHGPAATAQTAGRERREGETKQAGSGRGGERVGAGET